MKKYFFHNGIKLRYVNYGTKISNHYLNLPKSDLKEVLPKEDEQKVLIKQCSDDLYHWQSLNAENQNFIIHDGPPFANGNLHLGHALNKILKDIINRFQLIYSQKKIVFQVGWDCHGLPIEVKALNFILEKTNKQKKNNNNSINNNILTFNDKISACEVRKLCKKHAETMIDIQRTEYKNFAIMTDFNHPYITMHNEYEMNSLWVFLQIVKKKLLIRNFKPVWWSCENKTALADAELDYNHNHISTAVYFKYDLINNQKLIDFKKKTFKDIEISSKIKLLVWTSLPWTLFSNKAVCLNKDFNYVFLKNIETSELVIVGEAFVKKILQLNNNYSKVEKINSFKGHEILGLSYNNQLAEKDDLTFKVLHGDHVTETMGTGLVHISPSNGDDDFKIGKENNFKFENTVDEEGRFIGEKISKKFFFLDGQKVTTKKTTLNCIKILKENNMIFYIDENYNHSYPYDWRSKCPVIKRSTSQWFIDLEKLKFKALESLNKVTFIPLTGKKILSSLITNRKEWCISRQRFWGIPIPIVFLKKTNEPILHVDVIEYIIQKLKKFGCDEWFKEEANIDRWLPEKLKLNQHLYMKSIDTLDVWFDSGTSWSTLFKNMTNQNFEKEQADIYFEGNDQYRGWFQSSLLTKIISIDNENNDFKLLSPFKTLISHGFILDKNNDKMSKSKGNIISPTSVIRGSKVHFLPPLGTDGLRLWVASSEFTCDISIDKSIILMINHNYKKLRSTFKFFIGNLKDFKTKKDYDHLNLIDKFILSKLYILQQICIKSYKDYDFKRIISEINNFTNVDLSSLYFDVSKDCLYTDYFDSFDRRCIQTVLFYALKVFIGLLSPILPLLTQEAWNLTKSIYQKNESSPFMIKDWDSFYQLPTHFFNKKALIEFDTILKLKKEINKFLEDLSKKKFFTNRLELEINILSFENGNKKDFKILKNQERFLEDLFLVSKVFLNNEVFVCSHESKKIMIDNIEIILELSLSKKSKCIRCWKYIVTNSTEICNNCNFIVNRVKKNLNEEI